MIWLVSVDDTEDRKQIENELDSDLKEKYPQNVVSVKKKSKENLIKKN